MFLTALTYESMLHDFFTIGCGKVFSFMRFLFSFSTILTFELWFVLPFIVFTTMKLVQSIGFRNSNFPDKLRRRSGKENETPRDSRARGTYAAGKDEDQGEENAKGGNNR